MVVVEGATDLDLFAEFCAELTLESGASMEVEAFQRQMLSDYFDGCTETVVLIGKKNGKTSLVAALALFHLLTTMDAECVIGASSRDQATILFNQAAGLITRSRREQTRENPDGDFVIKKGFREIRSTTDSGRIRVLAADANTADGVIPTLAIVDELHRHRNADLYGVFRDGLGPRDGQIITISTAGADEATPLGEMRKRAYKLPIVRREGRAYRYCQSENGEFCMHEWALEAKDDPDDMKLVKEANPASWQTLERLQARHDSPTTMSWQWLRFACGVWVRGFETWIPRWRWDERAYNAGAADDYHACDAEGRIPRKREVVLAFDGSFNGDSTGLVAVTVPKALDLDEDDEDEQHNEGDLPQYDGPPPHIEVVECWERPEDAPEDWTVPVLEVENAIRDACKRFRVREIACDTARWQRSFEILKKRKLPVVAYPQNPSRMIPATTRFHTAVLRAHNGLTHSGDERLGRHVENAVLKVSDAGGQIAKPSKTSPLKIDLAVCAIMAFDRAHYYLKKGSRVIDLNEVYQELYGAAPLMDTAAELAEEASSLAAIEAVAPQILVVAASGDPEFMAQELPRWGSAELVRDGALEPVDHDGSVLVHVHQGSPAMIAQLIARHGYGRVLGALNT